MKLAIALATVFALATPAPALPQPIPSWEQMQCFKPFTRTLKTKNGTFLVTYNCDGEVIAWTRKTHPPKR